MFDTLYKGNDARDQRIFTDMDYQPPEFFSHGGWHTAVKVPRPYPGSDGQDCEIQECRLPSRFFRLIVHPTPNSMGEPREGWILSTGSGDESGAVIAQVAHLVSQGMIGWHPYSERGEGNS